MASDPSERERILLGYAPGDPFGSVPNNDNSNRSSGDVDFTDVFGGPPRRSSVNELRRSHADSQDSGSWRASGSGSGSGLGERPVFGEVGSPARRRHMKDDFFSDIFQSGGPACSSPRRVERDSLNSPTPGSRVLSPTRPLPPVGSDAVTGGLSLPSQLSLSMKSVKTTNSLMSFPTQHALNKNSLEVIDSANASVKSPSQKDSTTLESYVRQGQFHFSIYKWAGKGVTLVMPSQSNLQHETRFKRLPEIVVQEVDVILHADIMSTQSTACKNQSDNLDKSERDVIVESKADAGSTMKKTFSAAEFDSKFLHNNKDEKSDWGNGNNEKFPTAIHEAQKNDLKNLWQLFDDDLDNQQHEEIIKQVEGTEDYLRGQQNVNANMNTKQQAARENKRNPVKLTNLNTQATTVSPEEKLLGSRVKDKVKDFMKLFNQEGSPKRKGTFETAARRSRGKDEGNVKVEGLVHIQPVKADEQVKTASKSCSSMLSNAPVSVTESSERAEEVNCNMSFDAHVIGDLLSERKDPLMPCSDSTPDIVDDSVDKMKESHYEELDGHLVELFSQDLNKDLKSDSDQDQIKATDAKIREWSKGKEGNIRALLSTLQYVLWPESGWKPIPLVDIIEGSSVKRAYQKALLRLHPDKLQQKGAAAQQKYIAEKVFDIMQEAWDQFNSVGQIY